MFLIENSIDNHLNILDILKRKRWLLEFGIGLETRPRRQPTSYPGSSQIPSHTDLRVAAVAYVLDALV